MSRWDKYNQARYNKYEEGKLQCPICDGWYHRLASHTRQKHNISAKELKKMIGEVSFRGLTSQKSHDKSRKAVFKNPHCIRENLIEKGKTTRIKKGSNFRNNIR